jgi:predicted dehydrogenase
MGSSNSLRVGVLGAGRWAGMAHIPGWQRDPRSDVVAVCDIDGDLARQTAAKFSIPNVTDDWQALIARSDIDVVDVCTSNEAHFALSVAALEAGKHVLCEKPVAHDYRETMRAAELARQKGLKTKLGFTFRYSPGVRYAAELIAEGFIGEPYIFNGYEQNSQWIKPATPLRRAHPGGDQSKLLTASLEGYGAPIIDIGRWWMGADYQQVIGTMRNFVPERVLRASGELTRLNIDDGDIFLAEFSNGTIGSVQSSYVTVGNFPGVEARIYGSKGAIICRLVEEFGVAETIKTATPDDVEFKVRDIPQRFYPTNGHPREYWPSLFYANLIRDFIDEIVENRAETQGDFVDGAKVQEVINAVERSFHERRWVSLPLANDGS